MSYIANSFDEHITGLLKNGRVGFMPSDTIYGLSCDALNEAAVKRLHDIKSRDKNKSFIVLISDIKMLNLLSISESEVEPAKTYWPGSLTLVCKTSNAPEWLTYTDGTIAVRMPAHKNLLGLINKVGPLISTSANLTGGTPAKNIKEAQDVFGDKLDFYVDTGELNSLPSTLVRNNDGKLEVLRQGAVKIKL